MLEVERSSLGVLSDRSDLGVYLREDRKVGRGRLRELGRVVVRGAVDVGGKHRAGLGRTAARFRYGVDRNDWRSIRGPTGADRD